MTANIFSRQMTMLANVCEGGNTQVITIADFCNPARQYQYAQQITAIRAYCTNADMKERNREIVGRLKTSLPAGIVSCVADGLGEANVRHRNGVIAIDIDQSKNPAIHDWEAVKRELAKSPYIAYCGLSVSGLGVWGLVPIADPLMHAEHFRALCKDFERQFTIMQEGDEEPTTLMGIHLDTAPSSIVSKRFVSYDPRPHINTSAKVYERTEKPEKPQQPQQTFFNATNKMFNVEKWLKSHGIPYNARYRQGGVQYIVRCPNAANHSSRSHAESAIFVRPDGRIGYDCKHDHCRHIDWHAYRLYYEPERVRNLSRSRSISHLSIEDMQHALLQAGFVVKPLPSAHVTTTPAPLPTPAPAPAPSPASATTPSEPRLRYSTILPFPSGDVFSTMTAEEFDSILSPSAVAAWQAAHPVAPF